MSKIPASAIGIAASCLLLADAGLSQQAAAPERTGPPCEEAGPQSPRDIDRISGTNSVDFDWAPPADEMNLCNVHFHKYAEHRAEAYSAKLGKGDHSGWACVGHEPQSPGATAHPRGEGCTGLAVGDTIEVHWVFTTCDVQPGPGLGSCGACEGQRLRVEAGIFYLTGDDGVGLDFAPPATAAVRYKGSTTGTKYDNAICSPARVTWNVRRDCSPLRLGSLDHWCANEGRAVYGEDRGQGVRELVERVEFLSKIGR